MAPLVATGRCSSSCTSSRIKPVSSATDMQLRHLTALCTASRHATQQAAHRLCTRQCVAATGLWRGARNAGAQLHVQHEDPNWVCRIAAAAMYSCVHHWRTLRKHSTMGGRHVPRCSGRVGLEPTLDQLYRQLIVMWLVRHHRHAVEGKCPLGQVVHILTCVELAGIGPGPWRSLQQHCLVNPLWSSQHCR